MKTVSKITTGRRSFLQKLAAGMAGTFILPSCKESANNSLEKTSVADKAATIAQKTDEARKLPKDLLFKLLDQKVSQNMHVSFNCAQSSFLALDEQFGPGADDVLKALTPLTGIAERGETCGAVVGSLMFLGLIYGRGKERLGDWDQYRKSLLPSGELCAKFEKKYGSTMCCNIQQKIYGKCYHLTNADELSDFQNEGATDRCSKVVQSAVRMTAEIILENPDTV